MNARNLQNKMRAMSVLKARLYEIAESKRQAEESATRRSQIGTGGTLRENPHVQLPPKPRYGPSGEPFIL